MTDEDMPGLGIARGRTLAAAGGPAVSAPDNPGASGDWAGYEARRREALASLRAQYDRDAATVRDGDSARPTITEAQYDDARARQVIASANMQTTTPDFISPSGRFEPGDLEAYQRQRAAEAADLTRRGGPLLTPEQQRARFDEGLAGMTPDARVAYWQTAANDYREQRAGEVAQADLRRRIPGPLGEAAAQAYALGLIGPVGGVLRTRGEMRRSLRPTPTPEAPPTACTTCNSQPAIPRLGDLQPHEIARIQATVERLDAQVRHEFPDRPDVPVEISVVGSAARGARRNAGREDLPIGHDPVDRPGTTRSDIDYVVPRHLEDFFSASFGTPIERLPQRSLPSFHDFQGAPFAGELQPGPAITFRPGQPPEVHVVGPPTSQR